MSLIRALREKFSLRSASAPPATLEQQASALLELVTTFHIWVRRRVELITFVDDLLVRRNVSIDFSIPEELELGQVDDELLPWIPLSFLKKEVLRKFDLRDAEGKPVPMLTKAENGRIATETLVQAAEAALEEAVPEEVKSHLRVVAEAERGPAGAEFRTWRAAADDGTNPHRPEWKKLVERQGFMDYAQQLAENFILLAVAPSAPGQRRLMKLSYEERLPRGAGDDTEDGEQLPLKERVLEKLGWRRKLVPLSLPAVALASSFHVEVPAPPDMEIAAARLRLQVAPGRTGDDKPPKDVVDRRPMQRAHLYVSDVPAGYVADALIYLRARRPGFLRAAALTSWLAAGLLAGGYAFLPDITSTANSQTAAALLLAGPGLSAGALIRPQANIAWRHGYWKACGYCWPSRYWPCSSP